MDRAPGPDASASRADPALGRLVARPRPSVTGANAFQVDAPVPVPADDRPTGETDEQRAEQPERDDDVRAADPARTASWARFPARWGRSRGRTRTFGLYGVPKMTLGMSDWTTQRPWCLITMRSKRIGPFFLMNFFSGCSRMLPPTSFGNDVVERPRMVLPARGERVGRILPRELGARQARAERGGDDVVRRGRVLVPHGVDDERVDRAVDRLALRGGELGCGKRARREHRCGGQCRDGERDEPHDRKVARSVSGNDAHS